MKQIFLLLLCTGFITNLYAQPLNRDALQVSSFMGYPITVGDNNNAGKQIAFNKLLPINVDSQPMGRFQIGAIPDQTVWHNGDVSVGFYVLTDTLRAENVQLSYTIDFPPQGRIIFNEQSGRFRYLPNTFDVRDFTVTFTAQAGNRVISQNVKFILMPATPPEVAAFGVEVIKTPTSSTNDYMIIKETRRNNVMLNDSAKTVSVYSVSGKDLIFENTPNNKLYLYNNRADIDSLYLFAERVIIREAMWFKQTKVIIYAKELIFEDTFNAQGTTVAVTASINTTPEAWLPITGGLGKPGAIGGNITLYIKEFKQTTPTVRFILNGGKGQDANNNTPGNGGNSGRLSSTVDVNAFSDRTPGVGGMKYSGNEVVGSGATGSAGSYVSNSKRFAWLHPNITSAVLKHAKDSYMNANNGFTNTICNEYTRYIAAYRASSEWNQLLADDFEKITAGVELESAETEMQSLMYRIGQNLDYFGNPIGWVPMLSFEVNKAAFEQEIEKAIRVMYLSYWLKNITGTEAARNVATQEAIAMAEQALTDNQTAINGFFDIILRTQIDSEILQREIEDLTLRVEYKKAELEEQAKNEVKRRNRIKQAAGVLTAVAQIAPALNTVLPGAGSIVSRIADSGAGYLNSYINMFNYADSVDYAGAVTGLFDTTTDFFQSGKFETISEAIRDLDVSSIKNAANKAGLSMNAFVITIVRQAAKSNHLNANLGRNRDN